MATELEQPPQTAARDRAGGPTTAPTEPPRARGRALARRLRPHLPFLLLLAAGVVMRAIVLFTYRPALVFSDSAMYLRVAADLRPGHYHPSGYSFFIKALPDEWGLMIVPLAQHLLGLAIAVAIYAIVLRFTRRAWLGALAAAPVLLDAQQLNLEQFVLADVLFLSLVVAACLIVLLARPPRARWALAAGAALGLLVGYAAVVRTTGSALLLVMVPVAVLLWRARGRRVALTGAVAAVICFGAVYGGYLTWFKSYYGFFGTNGVAGQMKYGAVSPIADCTRFTVPARERSLCPRRPLDARLTPGAAAWASPEARSIPRQRTGRKDDIFNSFATRVVRNQPLDYARLVVRNFVLGFQPRRINSKRDAPAKNWKFRRRYPRFAPGPVKMVRLFGDDGVAVEPKLAVFLHGYSRFMYVPGPLLALCLVVALAAAGVGRARDSGVRLASLLLAGTTLAVLLPAAMVLFSWRYQLPQLALLPMAGAIGASALLGRTRSSPAGDPVATASRSSAG